MTGTEYQEKAMRTCNLEGANKLNHSLHGMVGEVGEIHSLFQKEYQGHPIDKDDLQKEIGDLLWFVTELIDYFEWDLDDIMHLNIKKLKKRYPNGFDSNKSINREEE